MKIKTNTKPSIYIEEYAKINGINQFLLHSGTSTKNPVMLFVHGGPGTAGSIFSYAFQKKWEDIYTVVHWDQRGSGKTLTKNPASLPTFDLLMEDMTEIVTYLKNKYQTDTIVILGHSWGTVIAAQFVEQHPTDVQYYIAVSQVVNKRENERIGYEKVKEVATQANDRKALQRLDAIGDYPGDALGEDWLKKSTVVNGLKTQFGLAPKPKLSVLFKSPIFGLSDFFALVKGTGASKELMKYLGAFNLAAEPAAYAVPVYYIYGENDWQTPLSGAQKYFDDIKAPDKKLYIIPSAGHMPMYDQPDLFFDALVDIKGRQAAKG